MFRRLIACVLIATPTLLVAANKEMQELQRDVAQLQDMLKTLQRSQDERFAALQVLVQQSLNAANDANKAVAVIQSSIQQNMKEQGDKVVQPVVGLATRMDSLSGDFRSMQTAMSDLVSTINRMQTQLTDLSNAVKVMQAPPAPPPTAGGDAAAAGANPPMSGTDMLANADRDRLAGRNDMALQGYSEFLKYYGNDAKAPDAQFYIGLIHYGQNDYAAAAKDFDTLLERAPAESQRVPQAYFYKGMSLLRSQQKTAASDEFIELIKQYPSNDLSKKACDQLKELGKRCPVAAPPVKRPPSKKR
jgi:TolA-binding protein